MLEQVEVVVVMEHGRIGANGDGCHETIDRLSA